MFRATTTLDALSRASCRRLVHSGRSWPYEVVMLQATPRAGVGKAEEVRAIVGATRQKCHKPQIRPQEVGADGRIYGRAWSLADYGS